ncbi:EF-hand domain-containing protein [Stenotrophomonas acidaminiphila]|uniref:EF-hand domain-containing protein n=1 Tax=Stenotrophomonas acidaminiphila TaxID=128780 RepID=UPI0028A7367D|nr:EF-hand domain-containing protein [Stenotrophomonas acidaminiphila]
MKRYASLSMMTLFLMAGAAVAGGQTTTPTTDHSQHKPMDHKHDHGQHAPAAADADFTKLDTNKDGALSKEELAKHKLASHFDMLDGNKDGKLNPQEFAAGKGM